MQDNNEAVLKDENLNHLEIGNYNWHLTKLSLINQQWRLQMENNNHWFGSMDKDLLDSVSETVSTEIERKKDY